MTDKCPSRLLELGNVLQCDREPNHEDNKELPQPETHWHLYGDEDASVAWGKEHEYKGETNTLSTTE